MYTKKRNRKSKRKTNRKRNQIKKRGGGLLSFGNEVLSNIIIKEIKPNKFKTFEKNTIYNKTYETTVTPDSQTPYSVFFITPQTLIFNNVNATRVPTFIINQGIYNIKIKNRYVNYLVKIEEVWYAILRIVLALNTSYFASYTYTIFYKLNDGVIQFDEDTNNITINDTYYDSTKESTFGLFKNTSNTIVLKESSYQAITDKSGDIFYALRKFRNVQIGTFDIKQSALNTSADVALQQTI
jgi:hypothetical protein